MNTTQLRTEGYVTGDKSRQQILDAALRLFAEDGINSVSMRRIAQEAGQSNVSATQYYFGSKANLVTAILQHIYVHIGPLRKQALNKIEEREDPSHPDYVRRLLAAAFAPHVALIGQGKWGQNAIRFMTRLVWEGGHELRKEFINTFNEDANRIVGLLHKALPEVPLETLQLRFMFALTNVVHGLADLDFLEDSPFGPMAHDLSVRGSELGEVFMDYVVAGITQNNGARS